MKNICKICNFESKSLSGLCRHVIFTHKISTKKYYDQYFKKDKENICNNPDCKKHTRFVGLTNGYNKYCSHGCASSNPKRRKQIGKSNKKNWSQNPARVKELIKRNKKMWKDDDLRNQMLRSLRKTGSTKSFKEKQKINALKFSNDPAWRQKVSIGTKKGQAKNPHFKEKRRQYMLNGGAAYCNRFIKNPSKPQVELFQIIKKLYPDAILNYQCMNFSIDIAIPTLKVAIEYDGSYWHQNKNKDLIRQQIIEKRGWKFLRYVDIVPSITKIRKDIEII